MTESIHWLSSVDRSAWLEIDDPSAAVEARRLAGDVSRQLEFDDSTRGEAAIVATELASNLARHARGGRMFLRALNNELEILTVDRGPGIVDVGRSLADGYSTAGTPGTGLGAVRRLSRFFEIHSTPGRGTAVLVRIASRKAGNSTVHGLQVGGVAIPATHETTCGDAWGAAVMVLRGRVILADGLGHGPDAAAAAGAALAAVRHQAHIATLEQQMMAVHEALRPTRGAAVAIADLPTAGNEVTYMGIGNIGAVIRSGEVSRSLVSTNGIAGHQMRRLHEFRYPWPPGAFLVMHSDGLTSQWALAEPGLAQRHPSIIAGVLARDFSRGRDDVSVLVVKQADA